jgi:hypothetical protein
MSALHPIADIDRLLRNVRLVPQADIVQLARWPRLEATVYFRPQQGEVDWFGHASGSACLARRVRLLRLADVQIER